MFSSDTFVRRSRSPLFLLSSCYCASCSVAKCFQLWSLSRCRPAKSTATWVTSNNASRSPTMNILIQYFSFSRSLAGYVFYLLSFLDRHSCCHVHACLISLSFLLVVTVFDSCHRRGERASSFVYLRPAGLLFSERPDLEIHRHTYSCNRRVFFAQTLVTDANQGDVARRVTSSRIVLRR